MKTQLFNHKRPLLKALCCMGLLCIMSSTAWAQADLWMQDNTTDTGSEPNYTTSTFCASPDIWITHTPTGAPQIQPISGALNWVHIRIRNRGSAPSSGTEAVYLYWATASMGLSWPTQWVSYTTTMPGCTATIYGNQIGSSTIPSLAASSGTTVIMLPWFAPDQTDYSCLSQPNHFCLLARIVPGMTYAETSSVPLNTQNNNNIVWRNVRVAKLPPGTNDPVKAVVLARNVKDAATTMRLRIAVPDAAGDNIFDHATIDMVLGDGLYAKWQANGAQGENIEDQGNGLVRAMNADARIDGIPMDPEEVYEAGFAFTRANADYTGVLDIDMIQEDDGEVTGAERFTVDFSDGADGLVSDVPDNTVAADGILVYPNPAKTEFTISNTDKSTSYSVRVLDIMGREVYSTSFSGDVKVNVAKFAKGTYYLELKNAQTGTQTVKQIIVE